MNFDQILEQTEEIGVVEAVDFPLVKIKGLPRVKIEELVMFESGQFGQTMTIDDESVEVLVFSKNIITLNTKAVRLNKKIEVKVGEELLGNIIDPLGRSLHKEKPMPQGLNTMPVEIKAKGIVDRKRIKEPFLTGISVIDLMVPLGRGQRELVLGDRVTGKTSFILQVLLKQLKEGVICVYGCIGKKKKDIRVVEDFMIEHDIFDKCVIIATESDDPLGLIHTTPYAAMTISEYFRDLGRDVLVVFDDMTNHAEYYREISLLSKKFPGRDSYPGDIFYAHSKLLERAGSFIQGSITCLPVVNTVEGDISGYIQTNLMSMTDGHIFFDIDLFSAGNRPAVNYFLSVTRVGRQTQDPLRWSVNRELFSFMSLYRRTENFVHFGAEVSEGIRSTLELGAKVLKFFNQKTDSILDLDLQIFIVCILWSGIWNNKELDDIDPSIEKVKRNYVNKETFRNNVNKLVSGSVDFNVLLGNFMKNLPQNEDYL